MKLYQVIFMTCCCLELGISVDNCLYNDGLDYVSYEDGLELMVVCSSRQATVTWTAGDLAVDQLDVIIEYYCINLNGTQEAGNPYRASLGTDAVLTDFSTVHLNYSIPVLESMVECQYYGCAYHRGLDYFYLFNTAGCVPGAGLDSISASQTMTPTLHHSFTTHSQGYSTVSSQTTVVGGTSPEAPQPSSTAQTQGLTVSISESSSFPTGGLKPSNTPAQTQHLTDYQVLQLSVVAVVVFLLVLLTALTLAGIKVLHLRMKKKSQRVLKVIPGFNDDGLDDSYNPVSTQPQLQLSVSATSIYTILDKFGEPNQTSPDLQSLNATPFEMDSLYERLSESLGLNRTFPGEQLCLGESQGKPDLKHCHLVKLEGSEYVYYDNTTDSSGYDSHSYFSVSKDYNSDLRTEPSANTLGLSDQVHPIDSGLRLEEGYNGIKCFAPTCTSEQLPSNGASIITTGAHRAGCETECISILSQRNSRTESSLTSENSNSYLLKVSSSSDH